nr:acyl carrier protein [Micromonospora sp. DSM 115978]
METDRRADVARKLTEYFRTRMLGEAEAAELTPQTPLLESGILNSVGTARLLAHLRDEFGVRVPPGKVTGTHFRNLDNITDLVVSLQEAEPAGAGGQHG